MEDINKNFLDSLDLPDEEMENHIPYVLQDLWELGSVPEYICQLIEKKVNAGTVNKIIDYGCGKGAVLVYLAKRFNFKGLGVDMVPEFIESANQYAKEHAVENQLQFETGDVLLYLDRKEKYDIVIYGYDSEVLGDLFHTILRLQHCLNDSGHLILELAFTPDNKKRIERMPTEKEVFEQLDKSGFRIIDKIFWDIGLIKTINARNNRYINRRIQELKKLYPEKTKIFEQYMQNQINECKLIENDMICSTWMLKNN